MHVSFFYLLTIPPPPTTFFICVFVVVVGVGGGGDGGELSLSWGLGRSGVLKNRIKQQQKLFSILLFFSSLFGVCC